MSTGAQGKGQQALGQLTVLVQASVTCLLDPNEPSTNAHNTANAGHEASTAFGAGTAASNTAGVASAAPAAAGAAGGRAPPSAFGLAVHNLTLLHTSNVGGLAGCSALAVQAQGLCLMQQQQQQEPQQGQRQGQQQGQQLLGQPLGQPLYPARQCLLYSPLSAPSTSAASPGIDLLLVTNTLQQGAAVQRCSGAAGAAGAFGIGGNRGVGGAGGAGGEGGGTAMVVQNRLSLCLRALTLSTDYGRLDAG